MDNSVLGYLVAIVMVAAFGYGLYRVIKASKAEGPSVPGKPKPRKPLPTDEEPVE